MQWNPPHWNPDSQWHAFLQSWLPHCPPVPAWLQLSFMPHSQWRPTQSISYGITFCHSQAKTCLNKTCRSFGLSDKPTSSVEDIRQPRSTPGDSPIVKNMLVQQSRTSIFLWVGFFTIAFPSHRLSAWLHRRLQSYITVCNPSPACPCPHPTWAPLCTDCMYDTTWNSKAIVQSRIVTFFPQYFVKSDDFFMIIYFMNKCIY